MLIVLPDVEKSRAPAEGRGWLLWAPPVVKILAKTCPKARVKGGIAECRKRNVDLAGYAGMDPP